MQAVLHSINTRLDAKSIAFQLDHASTKIVIVDQEFITVMLDAINQAKVSPFLVRYDDPEYHAEKPAREIEYVGIL